MNKNLSLVKDNYEELPNNIEAEQSVLGSILLQNEIFDDISTLITSINFYDPLHQRIFAAIENLIYKGMLANPITLKELAQLEEAELATRKAIELKPNLAEAYCNLGNILKELGKLEEAELATRK